MVYSCASVFAKPFLFIRVYFFIFALMRRTGWIKLEEGSGFIRLLKDDALKS